VLAPAFFFWLVGLALFWRVPIVSGRSDDDGWTVSVVIPARDEESNLGRLLASLARQEPPPHEVIVVDDHSRDATAAVARAAGATLVSAEALPDDWSGKPLACLQGAHRAKGRLLLFLDADTWLEPGGLARLVASYRETPGLVSVQPYHHMVDAYERLGALFNLITMIGVGSFTVFGRRLSPRAAFGPCVLVARDDYMVVGGHERAEGALLEGLPLGRAFADAGYEVRCLGGRGSVSFRMYPDGLKAMIDGFAKGFATGAVRFLPGCSSPSSHGWSAASLRRVTCLQW
jgi:4,4'-diaponeurosporenoate glycosyltransferase